MVKHHLASTPVIELVRWFSSVLLLEVVVADVALMSLVVDVALMSLVVDVVWETGEMGEEEW